ncbi:preferentially expressed antigen in melanoma-like protein 1 [Peromyscus californicus insignis]|uniref:preferentially expressed antigen in melanoma-like protein 1 n=1 Tax=Peromyscus californicus insignis TaxID=564181 RepID=UPI0022A7B7C9|nr:preferentially expressed antigen in melanoma-like protein 1 [Peromyscus californicus insignis]
MSSKTLLTLQELAGQRLLREEALANIALKNLPIKLLPPLLKQAYAGNHVNVLRTIVSSWPFPRLPLGALKRTSYLETQAQVVLEEIDKLLIQEVRPRQYKLEVLDLRSVGQNYLDMWPGSMDNWLPQTSSETQAVAGHSKAGVKTSLKVVVDLFFMEAPLTQFLGHLLEWSDKRKGLLQLYCNELHIWSAFRFKHRKLSEKVNLEYVETLGLHDAFCNPVFLLNLVSYLGCMRNLRKLSLTNIQEDNFISPEEKSYIIIQFTSQFLNLECLQKLHLERVPFLEGHLHQLLGSVKTPLDDLDVTHCTLSVSEWDSLSEFPCVSQLQQLNLQNVILTDLSPEPLQVLLVKAGPTLVTLDLEDCQIEDQYLYDILPALSSCLQLNKFSFYGNQISLHALRDLLHHTASLRKLRMELYPVPQESYNNSGTLHMELMREHCDELMDILKAIREPGKVFFGTERCFHCDNRYIYNKTQLCECQHYY